MNLSLKIARRYLFAKRSTNAINIITSISVFGITVGTAALLIILSVFNGFEDLITGMYNNFNPDLKITPVKGKTFYADSTTLVQLRALDGVQYVSETLEEVGYFKHRDNDAYGVIKGVDDYFALVNGIDSMVRLGSYKLSYRNRSYGVFGYGLKNKLGIEPLDSLFSPIKVYMIKQRKTSPFESPFYMENIHYSGTFIVQPDFDNQYLLTSISFARDLLKAPGKVTAYEIKLFPGYDIPNTYTQIQAIVGDQFEIKNRDQQEEAFFKLMKMEKWLGYAVVGLMTILVAFNMIGALWLIVLDKKRDIAILKSMGAKDTVIRNIFLNEGLLLSIIGLLAGFVLAVIIYLVQKNVGIVSLPGNSIIQNYPMSLRSFDFITVSLTVLSIGFIASIIPALRAQSIPTIIGEE